MARPCSICTHDQRREIDRDLLGTEPLLRIAKKYRVAESSLRRHRDHHLAPAAANALARREDVTADRLMAWLVGLLDRLSIAIMRAEADRDWNSFRALVREHRETAALLGRLTGVLDGPTVHVDARTQTAVLGQLSDEDLRALAGHARELAQREERPALAPPVSRATVAHGREANGHAPSPVALGYPNQDSAGV
jgi:hypothetical protein